MNLFSRTILRRLALPICLLTTGAALSACGPNLVGEEESLNPRGGVYSFGQASDSTYDCPGSENVIPPDDRLMDGTHRYVACPARASTTKIKLVGYSSSSRMSCVFPVQYINESQFVYKLDASYQPMFKCYDGWASEDNVAELDFPATNFNGVIVVDQASRPLMSTCLVTGHSCPMHAIGKFR